MSRLNVQKLSKSNFIDRLLEFVKDYEKATNVHFYNDVVDWIIEEKNECIKEFLSSKPLREIDNVLLDRKKSLYKELLTFYE